MNAYAHGSTDVLDLILIIAAVVAICAGLYKLYLRDLVVGGVLVIAGIIVLAFAT